MADEIGVERADPPRGIPWVPIAAILLILGSVAYGLWRARGAGQLTACQSNVKNLVTAVFMYESDHNDQDPIRLDTPGMKPYIRAIPTCPAAGRITYAYETSGKLFTIYCKGDSHRHFLPGPETADLPRSELGKPLEDHP